ncbi:MAG: cytochrome P460 family protein [Bacteroidia bacterium]|nr:cytochrome P460 family protein [Bacteroidia bacterium]
MMNLQKITTFTAVMTIVVLIASCTSEEVKNLDETLFEESTATGLTYYRNGEVLEGKSPSPHGSFKLAFNDIAAGALNSEGELDEGGSFPTGSLIVKEIMTGGELSLIASMKKDASNDQSAEGWIWGEYNPDGSVAYSVSKKGKACTGCHGGDPNRDLTRTFDLH